MTEYVIECNGLTKKYKNHCALDHLTIQIAKGEIFGLIGQNGAGKSTMMKMLSGLAHPSEGDFKLFGKNPTEDPQLYHRIGTLIESPGIYANMTAMQNMHIKALALGCDNSKDLRELLDMCGLKPDNKKKAKAFSLGMKQRLGLALAMIGNPELLILDEPVNGLDPQGIMDIRNTILKFNKERNITILLSSHMLEELSKIATSYGIIKDGALIKHMSREDLEIDCKDYCRLEVNDTKAAALLLEKAGNVKDFKVVEDNKILIYDTVDTSVITELLVKNGIQVFEITMHKQNLEAYFLNVTGGKNNVE